MARPNEIDDFIDSLDLLSEEDAGILCDRLREDSSHFDSEHVLKIIGKLDLFTREGSEIIDALGKTGLLDPIHKNLLKILISPEVARFDLIDSQAVPGIYDLITYIDNGLLDDKAAKEVYESIDLDSSAPLLIVALAKNGYLRPTGIGLDKPYQIGFPTINELLNRDRGGTNAVIRPEVICQLLEDDDIPFITREQASNLVKVIYSTELSEYPDVSRVVLGLTKYNLLNEDQLRRLGTQIKKIDWNPSNSHHGQLLENFAANGFLDESFIDPYVEQKYSFSSWDQRANVLRDFLRSHIRSGVSRQTDAGRTEPLTTDVSKAAPTR